MFSLLLFANKYYFIPPFCKSDIAVEVALTESYFPICLSPEPYLDGLCKALTNARSNWSILPLVLAHLPTRKKHGAVDRLKQCTVLLYLPIKV